MLRLSYLSVVTCVPVTLSLLVSGSFGLQSSFGGSRLANVPVSSRSALSMQVPILDDWKILRSGEVIGTVRNHPDIEDGDVVRTSPLDKPETALARKLVKTMSGSMYRLGNPSVDQQKANGKLESRSSAADEKSLRDALLEAKARFDLTGKVIGNGNYLLAGTPKRSTSGKSQIFVCYKNDGNGMPVGEALCAKISPNVDALRRESKNYGRVSIGFSKGSFVRFIQFYGRAGDDNAFSKQCAIIMERGLCDLKSFIEENGPLSGKALRDGAVTAVRCLQALHSSNLVWTDLKAENFVVTNEKKFTIKGIDLESAIQVRDNPVDYSPEACPPEFAEAFLAGDGPYFVLDFSYDIWSLGMMLYEISTAQSLFSGKSPSQITKILKDPSFLPDTSAVSDDNLRDLITSCLQKDPKKRPKLAQILLHPYFFSGGIGPFSF